MARKQLQRLQGMGYKLLSGFENEFVLYKEGTKETIYPDMGYLLTSLYATSVSTSNQGKLIWFDLIWFDLIRFNSINIFGFQQEVFQFAVEEALYSVGIETETMQAEGTGGQVRFWSLHVT